MDSCSSSELWLLKEGPGGLATSDDIPGASNDRAVGPATAASQAELALQLFWLSLTTLVSWYLIKPVPAFSRFYELLHKFLFCCQFLLLATKSTEWWRRDSEEAGNSVYLWESEDQTLNEKEAYILEYSVLCFLITSTMCIFTFSNSKYFKVV